MRELFLKKLEILAASAAWDTAILRKAFQDKDSVREANWMGYFSLRTSQLAAELREIMENEGKETETFKARGGGFSIPPPTRGDSV